MPPPPYAEEYEQDDEYLMRPHSPDHEDNGDDISERRLETPDEHPRIASPF